MENVDTIMGRFSLKVLDASAYGYVMELRFLDFKQSSIKFEDDNEAALFNLTLSIFRKTPLNVMFSADLNQYMPIFNEELYNQIIDELISAYRKNRKLLGNKDEPKREELLEMFNDIDNTFLNGMLSYFIPGMDYFRSIYRQTFLPGTYTDGQMPDSLHKDNILYTQTAITAGDGSFTLQSTKEAYVHAQIGSSKDNVDTIMDVDSVDMDSLTTYDYDSDSVVVDTAELGEDYDTAYIDSLENADLVPSTIRKSLKLDKDSWPVSQEETSIIYSKKGVWTDRKLLRRIWYTRILNRLGSSIYRKKCIETLEMRRSGHKWLLKSRNVDIPAKREPILFLDELFQGGNYYSTSRECEQIIGL